MAMTDNPASRELGYCPCCGYRTLPEGEPGSEEVCSVCHWTDDGEQFEDPTSVTDANPISLAKARTNFQQYGAVQADLAAETREPVDDDRDPNWPYE